LAREPERPRTKARCLWPGKKANFICGGPVFLILPRLSNHASRHGIALHIEIQPTDRYIENATAFIIYKDELAVQPGVTQLTGPADILLRIPPMDWLPPETAFTSEKDRVDAIQVQSVLIDLMTQCRDAEGLTGPLPFENGIADMLGLSKTTNMRPPFGMRPLAPKTIGFFNIVM